jgi:hypothetical protein
MKKDKRFIILNFGRTSMKISNICKYIFALGELSEGKCIKKRVTDNGLNLQG